MLYKLTSDHCVLLYCPVADATAGNTRNFLEFLSNGYLLDFLVRFSNIWEKVMVM